MIPLSTDVYFLLYLGGGFLLIFSLWFYNDHKDRQRNEARAAKVIYHCIKCSQIYTGTQGSEECDCPQCGFTNGRLRF